MAKPNIPKHKQKSVIDAYKKEKKQTLKDNHDKFLSFSFKYLTSNDKFPTHYEEAIYFTTLLQRLTDICKLKSLELIQSGNKSLRCHKIDWERVSENNFGLVNEDQLVSKAYQFQVSANAYGRVHGFFINEVFYVRWLDPNHRLYE